METNNLHDSHHEAPSRHHHFVLVHGLCHGSWCWYKVATALRRAGHRITAPDMAACGASRVGEVRTFEEYSPAARRGGPAAAPGARRPRRAVMVGLASRLQPRGSPRRSPRPCSSLRRSPSSAAPWSPPPRRRYVRMFPLCKSSLLTTRN
ncbi:hypothetical protein BAE44_0024662 [Dichanthelium oligosanthes]|uniref:AB hydrolase-1 domain-containing protein n=1 Tax=Dichanthelium oligosanthes TaxID=888268 RepID=A0A1E5UN65_9POAL|nr:hypothetical protein BAE44_0024662 [Dichanthelium oligosanthes]